MPQSMPMTKYHQIYLLLREQLHEGSFAQGLPGELALMKQFAVARVTVRRALEQLAAEGMISREPGRGTRALNVVAANASIGPEKGQRASLTGLLENLVSMGLQTKVSVLEVETVTASASVALRSQCGGAWRSWMRSMAFAAMCAMRIMPSRKSLVCAGTSISGPTTICAVTRRPVASSA